MPDWAFFFETDFWVTVDEFFADAVDRGFFSLPPRYAESFLFPLPLERWRNW